MRMTSILSSIRVAHRLRQVCRKSAMPPLALLAAALAIGTPLSARSQPADDAQQHQSSATLQWVAGSPAGEGNLDGPAIQASFGGSLILHADRDNRLLVTDKYSATLRSIDSAGQVATLAGHAGAKGYADGPATQARFHAPQDAIRGPDGRVYVADSENHVIRVINADGSVHTFAGQHGKKGDVNGGRATGLLGTPSTLAFDAQKRLWVQEEDGEYLRIIRPDGSISTWAGKCRTECDGNWQEYAKLLTAAPDGTIWIGDATHIARIVGDKMDVVIAPKPIDESERLRFTPLSPGAVSALIGKVPFTGKEPVSQAEREKESQAESDTHYRALAFDRAGVLYVLSGEGIFRLPPGATKLERMPVQAQQDFTWNKFESLAIADDGRILLSNGDPVIIVLSNGALHPYAGVYRRQAQGELHGVHWQNLGAEMEDGIMAPDGSIYFLDRLNNAIYRLNPDGKTVLWAGRPDEKGTEDGPRLQARFRYPASMVFDAAGNLYVADGGNNLIRMITPDGMVKTLVGKKIEKNHDGNRVDGNFQEATFWHPHFMSLDQQRHRLYVVDDSPYIGASHAVIRLVDLDRQTVRTVTNEKQQYELDDADMERMERSGLLSGKYSALAVGPTGELYALGESVIWKIDLETGRHHIQYLSEKSSEAETNHYHALREAKSSEERDLLDNSLIRCEWLWCSPEDMVLDAYGNVYVSDSGNHTILRIDAKGNAAVIAGKLGVRGNQPGPLPGALNRPASLLLTPAGDLLIGVGESGFMLLKNPSAAAQSSAPNAGARSEINQAGLGS